MLLFTNKYNLPWPVTISIETEITKEKKKDKDEVAFKKNVKLWFMLMAIVCRTSIFASCYDDMKIYEKIIAEIYYMMPD